MPAAPRPVFYDTLATGTPLNGDAIISESFTISGAGLSALITGENVLAVEVHQNAPDSDDIVFGMSVTVKFTNSPPVIVQQPGHRAVLDGRPVMLSVIVDGDPKPSVQWFVGDTIMPGATNAYLLFSAAYPTNAGTYWITASNTHGVVTSSHAVLTVLDDHDPPLVTSAIAQRELTNIIVSFTESILASTATNANHFELFQTTQPSNRLEVLNAALSGTSAAILTTAARVPGINYSLHVNGVRDNSSSANEIAPDTVVALKYHVDLIAVDQQTIWSYFQRGREPNSDWIANDSCLILIAAWWNRSLHWANVHHGLRTRMTASSCMFHSRRRP
jgi:hypothetical protein